MRRLALFAMRRRWWVLSVTVLLVVVCALLGRDVHDELSAGGFADPTSESARATAIANRDFPTATQTDFVVLVTARRGSVDDVAVREAGLALTAALADAPGVRGATSYWALGDADPLRSRDGRRALVVASLFGGDDQKVATAGRLAPRFERDDDVVSAVVTGRAEATRQISERAEQDLQRSELLTAPLIFIALVVIFGSVVAALLPLAVGIVAVLGTFVILALLTQATEVSVFALNLATGLGLGLGIDYSLFVVSRYREEMRDGLAAPDAISRTMQTAGRTVAFSAATVGISLLALVIFPMPYLRSFAFAGIAVVALATFASTVVLPSVLAILGPRIEKGRVHRVTDDAEGRFWGRQATRVMRHPVVYAVGVTAVLLLLAIPFLRLVPGLPDDRVVPPSVSARAANDRIRAHFDSREADALHVVAPTVDPATDGAAIDAFARDVAALDGVARVDAVTGYYAHSDDGVEVLPPDALSQRFTPARGTRGTVVSVVPDVEPVSRAGEHLVDDVRSTTAPFGFAVGGPSAQFVDSKDGVIARLPLAIVLVAGATFVLLFLMTGSVLVPVKALALNVLSLTATFGAMVWIFQDGHLAGFLGFTATGNLDVFTPILMFCIAFGVSMDYEVFMLSRIKAEYDASHDNERSVVLGLQKTGGIVTAAALVMMIVFIGLATSQVALVKLFAVGLALAVLVDAFLIRATLVPAFMRLAGRANWWAPGWLRGLHDRVGLAEAGTTVASAPQPSTVDADLPA